MEDKTFTVSEINALINKKLKMDPKFKNILVKGEISNFSTNPFSQHSYFTLKDENSQIDAVMFKGMKDRFLKFKPEDGMKVIVKGKIEVYVKNGKYQLYATKITEDGIGDLHVAFEQLKKRLQLEGLFEKSHKKEIPKYPKRVGVITAKTGAAIRDIITTINRRYPQCEILIFPTLVQGDMAASQIAHQIRYSQTFDIDTLIVGRGGGSIEDLWAFNEEIVAREIYNCKIPVISAVGHETDYTISDFVSDLRAPTPTAAAELAVPDINKIQYQINQVELRLKNSIKKIHSQKRKEYTTITEKQTIKNPLSIYETKSIDLDMITDKLRYYSKNIISDNKNKLELIKNRNVLIKPLEITSKKDEKLMQNISKLKLLNPKAIHNQKEKELESLISKLNYTSKSIIFENENKLTIIKNKEVLKNPYNIFNAKSNQLEKNIDKLSILNPLKTLKRGYTLSKKDGKVVTSAHDVKKGDEVEIEFSDGNINTKVI